MATRRPVRIEAQRSAGDVLVGLAAITVLLGMVFGVPYALVRFFGSPIPTSLPTLDTLTQPIGPEALLKVLSILVWLAWAQLVICVITELVAGIRGVGVPARVPLAGGTQAVAHRLVTAALLLFTASAVVTPLVKAVDGPANAPPVASALHKGVPPQGGPAQQAQETQLDIAGQPPVARTFKGKKVYVVQPPAGRHHESLWEIAEKTLGDGRRYREIYRLNKHILQPDGSQLHIARLIRPGWVLDMPDDATGVHIVPADDTRKEILASHPGKPIEADGKQQISKQPADGGATAGGALRAPERRAGDASRPAPAAPPAQLNGGSPAERFTPPTIQPAPQEVGRGLDFFDYVAAASLLAAGLLAALGRRRREQMWHRAFGRRLPVPEGDAALAEMALRIGADAPGTRMLDVGLRYLSQALAVVGRQLPTVYGAHLSTENLDLWVHPADRNAPAPWQTLDGGQLWRLPTSLGRQLDERMVAEMLAPYPGLVSVGTDSVGRVLVDLEAAHGLISLRGSPQDATAALAALAVELATNRWSDHMRITLVGFGEELTVIAPERIRVVRSLSEVLPELEARAAEVRQALAAIGADSVLTGRSRGVSSEAWTPHYLLVATPPTPEEARQLVQLAQTGHRSAAGYIVAGEVPGAAWTWDVTPEGRAKIGVLGFDVAAQLLPARQYGGIVELFRTAEQRDGEALADQSWPDDDPTGPTAAQLDPSFVPSADIRILGGIDVRAPGQIEEARLPLACELAVYLAVHPGGVHPNVLAGVLWPRGVQTAVRDATVARVRDWLGVDSEGRPNLYFDDAGRLHLGPQVRTDWRIFRALVLRAARDTAAAPALLDRALSLVRGPLLDGRPEGRYVWLAADELEYEVTARVADAAHRLCDLRLVAGDPEGAAKAVRAGLLLAGGDEGLWRDLLKATHAAGDVAGFRRIVDTIRRRAQDVGGPGMTPETEALIDDLMPAWRLQVVNGP